MTITSAPTTEPTDVAADPAAMLARVSRWMWKLSCRAGRRHGIDAEDVYQEAAAAFLRRCRGYDPSRGALTTYAGLIVLYAVRRVRRFSRGRVAAVSIDVRRDGFDDPPAPPSDQDGDADRAAATNRVRDALRALTPRQRMVIALRYGLDGHEPHLHEQIRPLVGDVSRARVGQIEGQAIDRLRLHLGVRG